MKNLKFILASTSILPLAACSMWSSSPSRTVKEFYDHIDAGKQDAAIKNLSKDFADGMDTEKVKAFIARVSTWSKANGGVSSIGIQKEEITGDRANVFGAIKFKNGDSMPIWWRLIKEGRTWKIQHVG